MIKVVTTIVTGEGGGGQGAGGKKKEKKFKSWRSRKMRSENLISLSSWEARLTYGWLNFRKLRSEGLCLKFFMIPKS